MEDGSGGEGYHDGWQGLGRDGAGSRVDAEDAADGEVGGGECGGVDVVGEVGGSGAAEFGDFVVEVRSSTRRKSEGRSLRFSMACRSRMPGPMRKAPRWVGGRVMVKGFGWSWMMFMGPELLR